MIAAMTQPGPCEQFEAGEWRVQVGPACPDALRAAARDPASWQALGSAGRLLHRNPLIGSTVRAVELAGLGLVVKRRDYVGLRRRWRMAREGSSAAREFGHSLALAEAAVRTPAVYLLAERRGRFLPRTSLLVYQRIEQSQSLLRALADRPGGPLVIAGSDVGQSGGPDSAEPSTVGAAGRARRDLLERTARFAADLFDRGVYYGDLHPGNILVGGGDCWLIDPTQVERREGVDQALLARLVGRFVLRCAEPDGGGPWVALRWLARFAAEARGRAGWPTVAEIIEQARQRRGRQLKRAEFRPGADWQRVRLGGGWRAALNSKLDAWPAPQFLRTLVEQAESETGGKWREAADEDGRCWRIGAARATGRRGWAQWRLACARWLDVPAPVAWIAGPREYWVTAPPLASSQARPSENALAWRAAVWLARLNRWKLVLLPTGLSDWEPSAGRLTLLDPARIAPRTGTDWDGRAFSETIAALTGAAAGNFARRVEGFGETARRWVALFDGR